MKILIIFGTRPEAIKMAPVIKELKKTFKVSVCVTAQHREMLDQVLNIFNISPDYDLNIMKNGQDLYDVTTKVLNGLKYVFSREKPDLVLVHGDTTTSMVASLAAFYFKIPVAHVEAGLRTNDIYSPFPEELNRQVTSRLASYHFAPTQRAKENLIAEGVLKDKIFVTGNTVIDSLFSVIKKARVTPFPNILIEKLPFLDNVKDQKIVLITGHRRENFGDGFEQICESLLALSKKHQEVNFVYPVHLNPNVLMPVKSFLSNLENFYIIEPLEYLHFLKMMDISYLILTDSGGIQEEAPSLGKPVLVMRNSTERPEAVKAGTVKLVGTNKEKIINSVDILLNDKDAYLSMSKIHNPYGDGLSSIRIREFIQEILN